MDRFAALLVALAAVLTMLGGALWFLARISYQMGKLTQKFGDHVEQASKIHERQGRDIEDLKARMPRRR